MYRVAQSSNPEASPVGCHLNGFAAVKCIPAFCNIFFFCLFFKTSLPYTNFITKSNSMRDTRWLSESGTITMCWFCCGVNA